MGERRITARYRCRSSIPDDGLKIYYEIADGKDILFSGTETFTKDMKGMEALSFLHTNLDDKNVQNPYNKYIRPNSTLDVRVWEIAADATGKPDEGAPEATKITTISDTDLDILSAEPDLTEKTVNVKFSDDLYGRYYIEVKNGGSKCWTVTECDASTSTGVVQKEKGQTLNWGDETHGFAPGEYTVTLAQNKATKGTEMDLAGPVEGAFQRTKKVFELYQVNYTVGGTTAGESQIVKAGTKVTPPAVSPAPGKVFNGWKINGTAVELGEDGAYTVDAKDATNYVITLEADIVDDAIVSGEVWTKGDDTASPPVEPAKVESATVTVEGNTITISGAVPTAGTYEVRYTTVGEAENAKFDITVANDGTVTGTAPTVGVAYTVTGKVQIVNIGAASESPVEVPETMSGTSTTDKEALAEHFGGEPKVTVDTTDALVAAALSTENGSSSVVEDLQEVINGVTDGTKVKIEVYLEIKPVSYVSKETESDPKTTVTRSLKLDITPMARVIDEETGEPVSDTTVPVNGFEAKTEAEAVTITVPIPTGFIDSAETEHVFIKHYKNGRLVETFKPISTTATEVTFKGGSFSEYEIIIDGRTVTVTFDPGEGTLSDSDDKTYTLSEVGTMLPVPTHPTKNFDGWIIDGDATNKKYKQLTDALLSALVELADDDNVTLIAQYSTKVIPPTGGGGSTTTTYPITAPTAEGGKVSVNSSAAAGATVTITTTPDEGKKVDTVTVTDVNGNAIAVTKADTNRYTFVMPSAAVTIKVTFVDGSEEPVDPDWDNPYSDVKEKDWFYDAVKYVTENGLMQGTGKDKFEPDTKLTRGMFAQILYNKAGRPEVTGTVDFTDFESGKWYSDAVVWASKNGVLKGYDDGSVGVNDKITREQLATMLWRYVGEPEASADVTVNGSPSKYAVEAMRWAVGAGVIKSFRAFSIIKYT